MDGNEEQSDASGSIHEPEMGFEALRLSELDGDSESTISSLRRTTPSISSDISEILDTPSLSDVLGDPTQMAFPSLVATVLALDFEGDKNR